MFVDKFVGTYLYDCTPWSRIVDELVAREKTKGNYQQSLQAGHDWLVDRNFTPNPMQIDYDLGGNLDKF